MGIGRLLVIIVVLGIIVVGAGQYFHLFDLGIVGGNAPTIADNAPPDPYDVGDRAYFGNQPGEAITAYKDALDKKPEDTRAAAAMYRMGKCYEDLKKSDEALAAYKAFIAKYPNDHDERKAEERIAYLNGAAGH